MCEKCQRSELFKSAEAEFIAAEKNVRALGLKPGIDNFIATFNGRLDCGLYGSAELTALNRYNAAIKAMRDVHKNFLFEGLRKGIEARNQRLRENIASSGGFYE